MKLHSVIICAIENTHLRSRFGVSLKITLYRFAEGALWNIYPTEELRLKPPCKLRNGANTLSSLRPFSEKHLPERRRSPIKSELE